MSSEYFDLPTEEEWYGYAYAVQQSIDLRQRRLLYAEIVGRLQEGEVVAGYCKLYGTSQEVVIVIEDFIDFNRAIDKLYSRYDPLMGINFRAIELETEAEPIS